MKKSFFREPTPAKIARRKPTEVSPSELDEALNSVRKTDNYLLVQGILVPEHYRSHRKFVKHGPEIIARHPGSQIDTQDLRQFPYEAKKEELEKIINKENEGKIPKRKFAGWGIYPLHLDGRKRRILFTSCFQAAQIYAYARQSGAGISVKPYADARKVRKEGAEIFVELPSRTEGEDRYGFKLMSIPVIDSPEKFVIAHNIGTNHVCKDIEYSTRYKNENQAETSQVVNLCGHVGAAYLGIIDHFWKEDKNKVPLNCGQFDIPTLQAQQFYKTLLSRVLIQETSDSKPRKLDRAEKNIVLSDRLKSQGYNWMFFPDKRIANQIHVRDYDWSFGGE